MDYVKEIKDLLGNAKGLRRFCRRPSGSDAVPGSAGCLDRPLGHDLYQIGPVFGRCMDV